MTTGTAIGTRIDTWIDKIVFSESKHEKINQFELICLNDKLIPLSLQLNIRFR